MERWQGKVAVVTGASAGIGAAIVKDLVNAGLIVVGLARRVERVEALRTQLPAKKQASLYAFKCDVSSEASVTTAFDWIEKKLGAIDILVNNAGSLQTGHLVDMNPQIAQSVLQTNVMGIIYCTQRAFKSMKERNFDGHVILINSIVGHKIMPPPHSGSAPDFNIYPPSKFAVTGLTEIYRQEFQGLGTRIKITSVSPGAVDTEIVPESIRGLIGQSILRSEDISQAVLFAISTPPNVQITEINIKPVGEMF